LGTSDRAKAQRLLNAKNQAFPGRAAASSREIIRPYPSSTLHRWKQRVQKWRQNRKDVLFYFDNDEKGYAPHDALRLSKSLSRSTQNKLRREKS